MGVHFDSLNPESSGSQFGRNVEDDRSVSFFTREEVLEHEAPSLFGLRWEGLLPHTKGPISFESLSRIARIDQADGHEAELASCGLSDNVVGRVIPKTATYLPSDDVESPEVG